MIYIIYYYYYILLIPIILTYTYYLPITLINGACPNTQKFNHKIYMNLKIEIDTDLYVEYSKLLTNKGLDGKNEIIKFVEAQVKKYKNHKNYDSDIEMKGFII